VGVRLEKTDRIEERSIPGGTSCDQSPLMVPTEVPVLRSARQHDPGGFNRTGTFNDQILNIPPKVRWAVPRTSRQSDPRGSAGSGQCARPDQRRGRDPSLVNGRSRGQDTAVGGSNYRQLIGERAGAYSPRAWRGLRSARDRLYVSGVERGRPTSSRSANQQIQLSEVERWEDASNVWGTFADLSR